MNALEFVLGQLPGAGVAAVIHQRDEGRLAVGLLVGQLEIIAEGAVDEFGAGIGIEQHDADIDLIERGRQAICGGMMLLLPRERIDPFLPRSPVMSAVPPAVTASSSMRARSDMS